MMKRIIRRERKWFFAILFTFFISLSGMNFSVFASTVTIPNATQFKDTAGNFIQAHGGGVIRVGNYYYWFGENRNDDDTFYAVSCYRSTDLKNWEFRNNVLTQNTASELASCKIERPKVIYNSSTNQYVMWMHKENATDYEQARAAVAVCSTVDGNYTWQGSFRPLNIYMSRDCTLFKDDDGSAYFISAANDNANLNVYKLTSNYLSINNLVTVLWAGQSREAPAMFKRNGYYYMFTSGCTGWTPNQQKFAYSQNISDGWSSLINIGNDSCFGSQTAHVIPVEGNQTTSYLFTGDMWAGAWEGKVNDSSYLWMPIQFNSNTSLSLNYYDELNIDTSTGVINGIKTKVNDNDTGFTYSGDWGYSSARGIGDYMDDVHYTTTNDNYFEYTFTGTGVDYITEKSDGQGSVDIYIDNVYQTTVNCYSATKIAQQMVYSKTGMTNGTHTIKCVKKGSTYLVLDALKIYADGGSTPGSWIKVDDDHGSVSYDSGWGAWSGNPSYMGTEHYSEVTGSIATFTFTGTKARYYGFKRNDLGNAEIYVDDSLAATIDCYSNTAQYNGMLYETDELTSGTHTLKVKVKGTKNAASSGTEVIVDAFESMG